MNKLGEVGRTLVLLLFSVSFGFARSLLPGPGGLLWYCQPLSLWTLVPKQTITNTPWQPGRKGGPCHYSSGELKWHTPSPTWIENAISYPSWPPQEENI